MSRGWLNKLAEQHGIHLINKKVTNRTTLKGPGFDVDYPEWTHHIPRRILMRLHYLSQLLNITWDKLTAVKVSNRAPKWTYVIEGYSPPHIYFYWRYETGNPMIGQSYLVRDYRDVVRVRTILVKGHPKYGGPICYAVYHAKITKGKLKLLRDFEIPRHIYDNLPKICFPEIYVEDFGKVKNVEAVLITPNDCYVKENYIFDWCLQRW